MQSVLFRTSFPVFHRRGRKTHQTIFPVFCRQTRRTEKLLEIKQALVSQYAGTHLALMVQGRIGINRLIQPPQAPVFASGQPKARGRTAVDVAPAHMGHGSLVTYRVQPSNRQSPKASWAAVRAIISAWAVASLSVSTWFQPRPITRPSFTTMAPTGTPLSRGPFWILFAGSAHEPFVRTGHFHHYGGYHGPGGAVLASSFWKDSYCVLYGKCAMPRKGVGMNAFYVDSGEWVA